LTGFAIGGIVVSAFLGLALCTYFSNIQLNFTYGMLNLSVWSIIGFILVTSTKPNEALRALVCLVATESLGALVVHRSLEGGEGGWVRVVEAAQGLYMDFFVVFWGVEVLVRKAKGLMSRKVADRPSV
jgi:TctA family transporter